MSVIKKLSGLTKLMLFVLMAQLAASVANARPDILALVLEGDFNINPELLCQNCHQTTPGNEGIGNLKPNYQKAYQLDTVNLSRLKNVINGCASGKTLNPETFECVAATTTCVPPKQINANGQCVLPDCPAGQVRNASGICVTPDTTACTPPLIKDARTGSCITSTPQRPMGCPSGAGTASTSSLKLSDPGKIVAHAGQLVRVGVVAASGNRAVTMGISSLPTKTYAQYYSLYNQVLRAHQGLFQWKVPWNEAPKTIDFNLCAVEWGSDKPAEYSENVKVSVQILPKLATPLVADPAITSNTITRSTYNPQTQRLEASGFISWLYSSTIAERTAAIQENLVLTDAETGINLATAKVNLDGSWTLTADIQQASKPNVVDAVFKGRLATEQVRQLSLPVAATLSAKVPTKLPAKIPAKAKAKGKAKKLK
jgi:hypothetical protein